MNEELLALSTNDQEVTDFGTNFPERVIQDVLKYGFTAIKNDTSLVRDMFHRIDSLALADIENYYLTHNITIRTNFPADELTFPMIGIVNASDDENTAIDILDDYMGETTNLAGNERIKTHGHALKCTFNIYCLTGKDANAVLWLYYLAKAILMANRLTLHNHGLQNIVFGGRDVTFRDDLLPELSFARILTLSCDSYFAVRLTEKAANALNAVSVFTESSDGDRLSLTEEIL